MGGEASATAAGTDRVPTIGAGALIAAGAGISRVGAGTRARLAAATAGLGWLTAAATGPGWVDRPSSVGGLVDGSCDGGSGASCRIGHGATRSGGRMGWRRCRNCGRRYVGGNAGRRRVGRRCRRRRWLQAVRGSRDRRLRGDGCHPVTGSSGHCSSFRRRWSNRLRGDCPDCRLGGRSGSGLDHCWRRARDRCRRRTGRSGNIDDEIHFGPRRYLGAGRPSARRAAPAAGAQSAPFALRPASGHRPPPHPPPDDRRRRAARWRRPGRCRRRNCVRHRSRWRRCSAPPAPRRAVPRPPALA